MDTIVIVLLAFLLVGYTEWKLRSNPNRTEITKSITELHEHASTGSQQRIEIQEILKAKKNGNGHASSPIV